jgi:predicted anti-sigma-YlaC factor YlaD
MYLVLDVTDFSKVLLPEMAFLNSEQPTVILKKTHNSLLIVFTARRFLSSVHTFPMTLKILSTKALDTGILHTYCTIFNKFGAVSLLKNLHHISIEFPSSEEKTL